MRTRSPIIHVTPLAVGSQSFHLWIKLECVKEKTNRYKTENSILIEDFTIMRSKQEMKKYALRVMVFSAAFNNMSVVWSWSV